MSDIAVAGGRAAWRGSWAPRPRAPGSRPTSGGCCNWPWPAIWLLDAVLQYQSFMFTKAFGQMLAGYGRRATRA